MRPVGARLVSPRVTAATRTREAHGKARLPSTLLDHARQIEHAVTPMAAALATWGKRLAAAELRRAMADPHRYAGIRKQDWPGLNAVDREITTILLRFGLRRAADVANKAAGEVIFTGSMLRDAIAGKPVKIKVFEEMRDGIVARAQDITAQTKDNIREQVRSIITDSTDRAKPLTTGDIIRRIATEISPIDDPENPDAGRKVGFSWARAELIARTELTQVENTARVAGFETTGVETLEWVAYSDGRSGDRHHERMDGKTWRRGDRIKTPLGNRLLYPGDPTAPIEETANCRCTVVPARRR
jgi:hypothetical protein